MVKLSCMQMLLVDISILQMVGGNRTSGSRGVPTQIRHVDGKAPLYL